MKPEDQIEAQSKYIKELEKEVARLTTAVSSYGNTIEGRIDKLERESIKTNRYLVQLQEHVEQLINKQ